MRWLIIILLGPVFAQAQAPNILWIVCEDISPTLSMYGDSTAKTPHLDQLAAESVVYKHAYAAVGVCGPSRSSIITGMYPTSIGSMHMRTGKDITAWGQQTYRERIDAVDVAGDSLRDYAVVPPAEVKCFPEYLRKAGYYCTNNQKTDYQFAAPVTAWDENSAKAHWRNRPEGKPFFAVFNTNLTHESKLWKHADKPLTVEPEAVPVPPYLPDNAVSRKDIARHYSNIELMDAWVGKLLDELKADGLYDNTIIFFYSDHGGPLPRQKREAYDAGLRVPFMVKMPGQQPGRSTRMISFVDLAPTLLSMAGVAPPAYMEGQAFLGAYEAKPRTYIMGTGDRFDEYTDRVRVIRTKRWLYVKNFFPEKKKYKDVAYRKNIPMMRNMLNLANQAETPKLNAVQQSWFESKSEEELYDCQNDPFQINDLAKNPLFVDSLRYMQALLLEQFGQSPDLGQLPEATLIEMMWPDGKQPKAKKAICQQIKGKITLSSPTQGASIAYLVTDRADMEPGLNSGWQVYDSTLKVGREEKLKPGRYLYVLVERLGYERSEIGVWQIK